MSELLSTLIEETSDTLAKARSMVRRDITFPEAESMIKVAIGMRRSGKTYFLYQTMQNFLEQGIEKSQILFLNLEDDRLLPLSAEKLGSLIDKFYSMFPENHNRRCYLFLDEIQNVPGWHTVVRRFHDTKDTQIFLTGSSAKLLSKEIATSLRGRSLAIEVWPYSFAEYCCAQQAEIPTGVLGRKTQDIMRQHLLDYFTRGGFPAVQALAKDEWRDTLQGYVDTVILLDVVERHNVRDVALLRYLTISLIKNAATPFSVNKFHNDISSQGYKVSKATLYNYLTFIEDAFLSFQLPFYSESLRVSQNQTKKVYAIDNGLVSANSLGTNTLYNKFLENQLYLDLRREGKDVYFYKTQDGYEIDFVTVSKNGEKELLQVCWDMSDPETASREKRALTQAEEELKIKGRIITFMDYLENVYKSLAL